MSRSDAPTTKVYVGKLPDDAKKEEVEAAFERYGKLQDVWVARNPPGFAFVEFYDSRDARDAVRELDGRNMCGARVIVELSHGRGKGSSRGGRGRPPFRDRYDRQDNRGRYGGRDDRDDRRNDRYRDNNHDYQRPRARGSPGRSRSPSPAARY